MTPKVDVVLPIANSPTATVSTTLPEPTTVPKITPTPRPTTLPVTAALSESLAGSAPERTGPASTISEPQATSANTSKAVESSSTWLKWLSILLIVTGVGFVLFGIVKAAVGSK